MQNPPITLSHHGWDDSARRVERAKKVNTENKFDICGINLMAFNVGSSRCPGAVDQDVYGAVLLNEPADGGFAVLSGCVALERQAEIPTPVRLMNAGSLIGVHALIVPGERPATATVREKCFLVRVPRLLMMRVLDAFQESAAAFKRYIEEGLAEQANALGRVADAIDAVARSYRSRESRTGT